MAGTGSFRGADCVDRSRPFRTTRHRASSGAEIGKGVDVLDHIINGLHSRDLGDMSARLLYPFHLLNHVMMSLCYMVASNVINE